MFRKNVYKWHRISSLIIAVPVLLWAVSGFLHPVMTNFRPQVATQGLRPIPVDTARVTMPLQQVLQHNSIDSLYSVRLIHIDTSWFYQLKTTATGRLEYFSALNGNRLKRGDWLYAQYLAKCFLEGEPAKDSSVAETALEPVPQDCCDAATDRVMHAPGAKVTDVSLVSEFDEEYKPINRLLPVYKVSFERADGIRLYVETGQSRFALAVDNNRASFSRFFSLIHTWGWLQFLGGGRIIAEVLLLLITLASAIMGLYIFFISKSKKVKGNGLVKSRRNHRYTALAASMFTILFAFSGAWHALAGWEQENPSPTASFAVPVSAVRFHPAAVQSLIHKPVVNIGLAKVGNLFYWQLYLMPSVKKATAKDLMKSMSAAAAPVMYLGLKDASVLNNGEELYARHLAGLFSGRNAGDSARLTLITRFTSDYNFTDKRLPVWKVSYTGKEEKQLFVETTSGTLAKQVTDAARYEQMSFALLHKHHFMDFAGKAWRDASTMFWAAMQIVMAVLGLVLYFKWRKKTRA